MTDFIFISANDPHISDTGPRSRIDNYKETILGKIGQMRTACNKLKADAALLTGDLFNLKAPSKNSHRLNQELIHEFKQFNCPIYMIPGNHDLTGNSLDSLNDQPLGVLFSDGTLHNLTHKIIEKNGCKVSLVGVPYTDNFEVSTANIPERGDAAAQICLLHIYASPKAQMLFNNRIYGYDELSVLSPDVFIMGHYHIDQGIQEVNGKQFINLGSLSRGSLSDEDINHHPKLGFIKISVDDEKKVVSIATQTIKLKIKPVEEVFDIKKWEEVKQESKEIEQFVDKLIEDSKEQTDTADFNTVLTGLDVSKAVKEKVLHFIQAASVK